MRSLLRALHTRGPGVLSPAGLGLRSTLDLNLRSTLVAGVPGIGRALVPRSPSPRPPVFLFRRVRCRQIERFWTIWLEAPGTGGGVGPSVHACSLV
jgi:hypothetical protein